MNKENNKNNEIVTETSATPKIELGHCYRFAMIGSTSSGKTCLLTKLAIGNCGGDRFTSIILPSEMRPLTTEEIKNLSPDDENAQMRYNFQVGTERINSAKRRLKNGQRPEPTANEKVRPMMTFKMTEDKGRGDFYVWTEDYPGELLNVAGLQDPDSHSSRLKKNLLNYDGLIIVVDSFGANADARRIQNDIENLNQFFSTITEEERKSGREMPIPVAVILSKWDRASHPIEFNDPEQEQKKLKQITKDHPVYTDILKSVSGNQGDLGELSSIELSAGLAWNNTALFPTSAFGKSIIQGQDENPDPSCLESFSLVEPFFWLAQRCDEIRIRDWEKRMPSHPFLPCGARKIYKEAYEEIQRRRIPPNSPCGSRLNDVLKKSSMLLNLFYAILIAILVFVADSVVSGYNQYRVGFWEDAINSPKQNLESLGTIHDRLLAYKQNAYNGLWAPGESRIQKDIDSINQTIDELKWGPVKTAIENAEKAKAAKNQEEEKKFRHLACKAAKEYVQILPKGPNAKIAQVIINEHEKLLEEDYWFNYVLKAAPLSEDQRKRAEEYLAKFPQGQFVNVAKGIGRDSLQKQEEECWVMVVNAKDARKKKNYAENYLALYPNGNHANEARTVIDGITAQIDWDKAKLGYEKELEGDSISRIVNALKSLVIVYETGPDRCGPLVSGLPKVIETIISEKSLRLPAKTMISECKDAAQILRGLEQTLQSKNDPKLAGVILASIQKTEAETGKHVDKLDEELYNTVVSNKNLDACNNYLDTMDSLGAGAMHDYVDKYKDYLTKSKETQDVKLHFDLYWGPNTPQYQVRGNVSVNGTDVYNNLSNTWKNATKELAHEKHLASVDPNQKIKIEVKFVSEGNYFFWGNNCVYGEGSDSFYLDELLKGRELKMSGGYGGILKVSATSQHTPNEPSLPTWSK